MHRSSIFNMCIDFEKSYNSYIYDKHRKEYFLDFFGLYASLPLGYSHPIFQSKEFRDEYNRIAAIKVPNCEVISNEAEEFLGEFSNHPGMKHFEYFHFCCTGALAIEAAIKVAMDQKGSKNPVVISLKESFHGINSYGGFVTDRFFPVSDRLDGFPSLGWHKIHNPKIIYNDDGLIDEEATRRGMEKFREEFNSNIKQNGAENIAALLIEPIQSTFGDNYFTPEFFKEARKLCDEHNICLIFDEVQTGFGATGRMWYFQHVGIVPDIVAFGKKVQVSGIMASRRFDKTFRRPVRLEVTWDGDLTDMVRSKYILRAYKQYGILDNVQERSGELVKGLSEMKELKNVRAGGLLLCFDFVTPEECRNFFEAVTENRLICNKTRDRSIRLRPNLNLSSSEVQEGLRRIKKAVEQRKKNYEKTKQA